MNTNHNALLSALQPSFDALKSACLDSLVFQHEAVESKLAESNFDLKVAYPYPHGSMSKREYRAALAAHNFANSITDQDDERCRAEGYLPSSFQSPSYVTMKTDLADRREKEAAEYAQAFIDAYAAKLAAKIGDDFEIATVEYTGTADPFAASKLTVSSTDGETQIWTTRCILNRSSLGKLFNQWPTRRKK